MQKYPLSRSWRGDEILLIFINMFYCLSKPCEPWSYIIRRWRFLYYDQTLKRKLRDKFSPNYLIFKTYKRHGASYVRRHVESKFNNSHAKQEFVYGRKVPKSNYFLGSYDAYSNNYFRTCLTQTFVPYLTSFRKTPRQFKRRQQRPTVAPFEV